MKYRTVRLTQGNINNNHLYLTQVMDLFPQSAIGGSNESEQASQQIELHSGIGEPVLTDIAGDKKIFRKRSWMREFFQTHKLKAGDYVVIEQTGRYRYHIYPRRG